MSESKKESSTKNPRPPRRGLSHFRNIGIIAHIDAGKTTLSERMLFYSGVEHRIGEVHEGTATMDYLPEERERGITITSAATTIYWQPDNVKHQINIIDTPGHVDFTAEVERSLRVLDGAVVVFCGVAGVQPQSETVWRQADGYKIPRLCFINKMDRVGADFEAAVASMQKRLNAKTIIMQIPLGASETFSGVIDLLTMKCVRFEGASGETVLIEDIPEEYIDEAELHRMELLETLAEHSEEVLDLFADDKEVPIEVLSNAVREATLGHTDSGEMLCPVFCGSAFKNIGVQLVLDSVCKYLPSPTDVPAIIGVDADTQEEVERIAKPSAPLSALAFKSIADVHGDLTFLRIYSGTIDTKKRIYNPNKKKKERIGRLFRMHADSRDSITEAGPGEIVAAIGLKFSVTGDTLCADGDKILLETMHFPDTVISMAIEPQSSSDKDKLDTVLDMMGRDDPTFKWGVDSETGQLIISGMGELHLEVLKNRLLNDYSIKANVGAPRVSYREALTVPCEATERVENALSGSAIFAEVALRIEPCDETDDGHLDIEFDVAENKIPKEFYEAVKEGIEIGASSGPRTGMELLGLKVIVVGGAYREGESVPEAFVKAARDAFDSAARRGNPIPLEPIMSLEVTAPDENVGAVVKDLNSRRAEILEMRHQGSLQVVESRVSLSQMFGYSTIVRSLTQGRATYVMEPYKFGPMAQNQADEKFGKWEVR